MNTPQTTPEKPTHREGVVHVQESHRTAFENAGLRTYSDWMALAEFPYREVSMRPKRPVVALRVDGIPVEVFLKRHLEPPRSESISQTLRFFPRPSEARKEVEKLNAFAEAGIPTPEVVAWGEGEWEGIRNASFIATRDLEATPLERHWFHNWQPPVTGSALAEKRRTIKEVAQLTRQMHKSGWVHRDFYLGHILVAINEAEGKGRLSVIDVQRAIQRPTWWLRPCIKDLASLHFSADPTYIRPADRIRFLRAYWETEKLTRWHKFLIRRILRKADRIRRHTEKTLGIPYSDFFKNKYY